MRHPPSCHCDACMKGHSDKVPSRRHSPEVHGPGDLVSFDQFEVGLGHMHGGQKIVMGFHDTSSRAQQLTHLSD